ncbi:MAG: hypothetical protein ACT452_07225 [Microthrixaceae bacterium]
MPSTTHTALTGTNLALVVGTLTRPAEHRTLPSGDHLIVLDLTVRPAAGPAESVPIAWPDGSSAAVGWPVGTEVLVVGRVRRRFFRAGGVTQSRTEVVATSATPTHRATSARKVLQRALDDLVPISA